MKEHGRDIGTIDEVSSLRLEHSTLSPRHQEEYVQLTRLMQEALETRFAPFIPELKREKNKDLAERVIVANNEDSVFIDSFYGEQPLDLESDTVMGEYMWPTHFIVINHEGPQRLMSGIKDENPTIGEEELQQLVNTPATLAHEITHAYFNRHLPEYFTEIAAHYYSYEMLSYLKFTPGRMSTYFGAVLVFQNALKQHGDTLHELVFSSEELSDEIKECLEKPVTEMCEEDEILAYVIDYPLAENRVAHC